MRSKARLAPPLAAKPQPLWSQLFTLGPRDEASLQTQIRRALVAAIADRSLPPATRLPASRTLALQLGVARNTISAVYRSLADDGFINARARSGYVVVPAPLGLSAAPLNPAETLPTAGEPRWASRIGSRYSTLRNITKPKDWYRYPYQFIYGQPDPALFPTNDWRECSRAALAVLAIRDWSSDMIDGDDTALIEQLQRRVLPQRGIFVAADQIMITIGTQHALYMLAELLVSARSVVGVEDPGYPDARNIFSLRGAALRPLAVGREGVRTGDLVGCDIAYLTPSHQCPTTMTMSLGRRRELLDHADRHDLLIIEDDYESELRYEGTPMPALKSLDRSGRVIYLGSLSKTLAPGLRIGYMVGARDLIAEARVLRRLMLRHPPANNQRAAALFISLGHHDALLRRVKSKLARRAAVLADALRHDAHMLSFEPPRGGSSVWVRGPEGLDVEALARAAEGVGVLIERGDLFFHNPPKPCRFFRLGYSSISSETIPMGIRTLASLLTPGRPASSEPPPASRYPPSADRKVRLQFRQNAASNAALPFS